MLSQSQLHTGELSISCRKCKREDHRQPSGVVSYFDPEFKCKQCGFEGRLTVTRSTKTRTNKATAARLRKLATRRQAQKQWATG